MNRAYLSLLLLVPALAMKSMAETVVEKEVTGIIEQYNTSVRSMIVSLSSAKSDAERAELRANGPKPDACATKLLALATGTMDETGAVKAEALDLIRTRYAGSPGVW
jgi:hypothetical protein